MIQNFFSVKNFEFTINRLPTVEFFVQTATIPGVVIPEATQTTPFANIPRPGNKLLFEDLQLTIKLDENMNSYREIFTWMNGMTNPTSFDQYKNLTAGDGVFSDASLIALSSKNNPILEFKFKNLFPTRLSGINLRSTTDTTEYATYDIGFKYTTYEIVDFS